VGKRAIALGPRADRPWGMVGIERPILPGNLMDRILPFAQAKGGIILLTLLAFLLLERLFPVARAPGGRRGWPAGPGLGSTSCCSISGSTGGTG